MMESNRKLDKISDPKKSKTSVLSNDKEHKTDAANERKIIEV